MRKLSNPELKRKSIEEFKKSSKIPIVIILDNIRSLHNVGSVFRTADAFLLQGIFLCGITASPPHREIQKTALGATNTVNWKYFTSTLAAITELKEANWKLYAIEQVENSISLENFHPLKDEKIALVFGNEIKGVAQQIIDNCDGCLEIPQLGSKHSLNISVSVGIVIWDLFAKGKK